MSNHRKPKRARKKDRRSQKREEWRAYVKRQRRKRWGYVLAGVTIGAVGLFIAWAAFLKPSKPVASPTPAPSAEPTSVTTPIKKPVACGASVPKAAGSTKKLYSKAAPQHLDESKTYLWRLETSCGTIDIELAVKDSPNTTNSVVFLTRQHFYDGTFFHRVTKRLVIQGGDPKGDGTGGPGYQVVDPVSSSLKYTEGTIAMAKGGNDPPGASGSQFFISGEIAKDQFTPDYALLGHVVSGNDVIAKIYENGHAVDMIAPLKYVYIERATIVEQ